MPEAGETSMNTEDAELVELLPCPFCGDENPRAMGRDAGFVYCSNDECGGEVRSPEYSNAAAIRSWNTRATASGITRVEEALAKLINIAGLLAFTGETDALDEAIREARAALAQDR